MSKDNIVTFVDSMRKSIAGVQKHFPNGITLGGVAYTAVTLTAVFQAAIDAISLSQESRAKWRGDVAASRDATGKALLVNRKLLAYVPTVLGDAPSTLADFGQVPVARKTPTVEAKAAATKKRLATRAARHTMGSEQKKQVTGAVTATVAPPATPASPPVAPSPVASVPAAPVQAAPAVGTAPHTS